MPENDARKEVVFELRPTLQRRVWLVSTPLRRVVLPRGEPSHINHGSALHSHAQRVSGHFKNDEGRAEAVGKVGRDGGGNTGTTEHSRLRTRSGKWPDGSKQVRWVDSKLLRSSPSRADSIGLSVVGARNVSGPSPMGSCCSSNDEGGNNGESRGVCDDACCPILNVLKAQRVMQTDG